MLYWRSRFLFGGVLALGALSACSTDGTSAEGKRSAATTPKNAATRQAPGKGGGKRPVPTSKTAPAPQQALPRLSGAYHTVFSLLDNRALAHAVRGGGLAVLGGHPGAAKYFNCNKPWRTWRPNQRVDGRPAMTASRSVSWLTVPLTAAQAAAARVIVLEVRSAKDQGVHLKVNRKRLPELFRLAHTGWQRVQLDLPAGVLKAGENTLEFRWATRGRLGRQKRAYAAIDWLYIGPKAPAKNASGGKDSSGGKGPQMRLVDAQGKLFLPKDGGLAWYVRPYAGAKLKLSFAARPAATRCAVQVALLPEGKDKREIVITRDETALEKGQVETFVDLTPIADKVGRLTLTARGRGCAGMSLTEAAIVAAGPAPTVQRKKKPKYVLFWMVDNWRADHFRSYNPKSRVETPVMSELARTGTVYDAYIVGTESRVSHASIWTGMFPRQHHFIGPKSKLRSRFVTLSEALKKAGFNTVGWTANGNVSKFWGFGEGWHYYRNTLHQGGGLIASRLADAAIKMIDKYGDKKPLYLFIGTIDPHVSWKGRQPWLRKYDPGPYNGIFRRRVAGPVWDRIAGAPGRVSKRDRRRILAIYDSTISYNDKHLGRVLAHLKEKGMRDDTMIVVAADHGEEFWEHGRVGHGGTLRETVVRVPLLIHYPPLFGHGVRVYEGADVHSIMATVLDAVGVPIPDGVQAGSLLPLAQGVGRGYPRPRFASQYELAYTMRIGRYKMWIAGKRTPRLYDIEGRYKEAKSVAASHPLGTRQLMDALSTFLVYQSRWRQARWGVPNNHSAAFSADFEQNKLPKLIR